MVGKIHKKKISEYTEAAENEEKQSEKGDDVEEEVVDNIEAIASGSESENGDVANNDNNKSSDSVTANDEEAGGDDDEVEETGQQEEEEVKSSGEAGEDEEEGDDKGGKKAKKRKAATAKKVTEGEGEEEELNGGTPKKRGRKLGSGAKGKGASAKASKTKAKKVAADDDDDEDGEEEYEVKDIVGHKTERGVSYFLIRWKGYTKADDTWEAEDTLNCSEIIDRYKKKEENSSPKKGSPGKKGKKPAAKGKKEEPEKEWEVEKIIDYAEEKKGRVFRIRWKGFGPKSDTWEPEDNLNCHDIIQKFLSKMKLQENVSFKELREEPKKTKRLFNETAPRTNINNPIGRKSKRSVTKKSDDEYETDDEVQSAPVKKSINEFERLCKSISETVSKINTSIDEPLEDNVDLQFLKMMLSLMKDMPTNVKNKFQSDMFAEIYKIRAQGYNEIDRNRTAVVPQQSPSKQSNAKAKSKKKKSTRKRYF